MHRSDGSGSIIPKLRRKRQIAALPRTLATKGFHYAKLNATSKSKINVDAQLRTLNFRLVFQSTKKSEKPTLAAQPTSFKLQVPGNLPDDSCAEPITVCHTMYRGPPNQAIVPKRRHLHHNRHDASVPLSRFSCPILDATPRTALSECPAEHRWRIPRQESQGSRADCGWCGIAQATPLQRS